MKQLFGAALLTLAACSSGGGGGNHPGTITPTPTPKWEIGPTIDGKRFSTGSVAGNVITVQDVHYVTQAARGPLTGTMHVGFNLTAALTGTGCGTTPATASLYFQRKNDDWNTDGKRWWATFATVTLDHAGDYSISAPMSGLWTSVEHKTAASAPGDFADAKQNPARVGFTIGNCTGFGHGGRGPATLTITAFDDGTK